MIGSKVKVAEEIRVQNKKIARMWCLIVCLAGAYARANGSGAVPSALPSWHAYFQDFRRNHHLALTFAASSGQWHYSHPRSDEHTTYNTRGLASKFDYSYRIAIGKKFGYLLGSSFGYSYEDVEGSSQLRVGSIWRLPGILAGGVWCLDSRWNLLATVERYLERVESFAESSSIYPVQLKATMLTTYDLALGVEYFSALFWGTRVEFHQREVAYIAPNDAEGKAEAAGIFRNDRWLGIGVVHHIL